MGPVRFCTRTIGGQMFCSVSATSLLYCVTTVQMELDTEWFSLLQLNVQYVFFRESSRDYNYTFVCTLHAIPNLDFLGLENVTKPIKILEEKVYYALEIQYFYKKNCYMVLKAYKKVLFSAINCREL